MRRAHAGPLQEFPMSPCMGTWGWRDACGGQSHRLPMGWRVAAWGSRRPCLRKGLELGGADWGDGMWGPRLGVGEVAAVRGEAWVI